MLVLEELNFVSEIFQKERLLEDIREVFLGGVPLLRQAIGPAPSHTRGHGG